jgi:formiminotetrahydrofolate cyclodeaminase
MNNFLKELAQAKPDPGGGAAAAHGANLGLALLEKVVRLEGQRRRKLAGSPGLTWEEVLARLRRLAESLEQLQAEDIQAYFNLVAARTSGDAARLAAAVREAVECPRRIMTQTVRVLELMAWVGERCQKHLVSDLLVAGEFLGAALRGAYHIAGANLRLVAEDANRQTLGRDLGQAGREGEDLYQLVKAALMAREDGLDRCRG